VKHKVFGTLIVLAGVVALVAVLYAAPAPPDGEATRHKTHKAPAPETLVEAADHHGGEATHAVDLGHFEQVYTIGSEVRGDKGSVSRLKDHGHMCTIVDNEPNFRNAASVCSNLRGRAITVRDKNGVRPGAGRQSFAWKARAHVGMEWKDRQGDYHGAGPVSRH
jgi:hypothetical protein